MLGRCSGRSVTTRSYPPLDLPGGPGFDSLEVDVLLSYSNRPELTDALERVLTRIRSGEECATEQPATDPPIICQPQTRALSDEQVQGIFRCYRAGTGPRELAKRYDVTERAIKYLLKKHGIPQQRTAWKVVTEGRS